MMHLLGATSSRELIFVDFDNDYGLFSCSFVIVSPFSEEDEKIIYAAESMLECIDDAEKYHLCDRYNCTPNELANEFLLDNGVQEVIDCSCYSEVFTINHENWYFETVACGQCDPRDYEIEYFACRGAAYKYILKMWDTYHLTDKIDDQTVELMDMIFLTSEEEEKWIKNYIMENF